MADGTLRIGLELDKSKIKADFQKLKIMAEKIGEDTGESFSDAFDKGAKGLLDFTKDMELDLTSLDSKIMEEGKRLVDLRKKLEAIKPVNQKVFTGTDEEKKRYEEYKEKDYYNKNGSVKPKAMDDGANLKDIYRLGQLVKTVEYTEEQKTQIEQIKKEEAEVNEQLKKDEEKRTSILSLIKQMPSFIKQVSKSEEEAKPKGDSEDGFGINWKKLKSNVIKYGTALLGVRGAMGILRKGVSAFMQQNERMQNQLKGIWSSLGEALSPAIEGLFNILLKGVAIINAFVKALFGIDLVARANAKSLAKQNSAMKKTKDLASFDEMNKMSDSGSGSSFGGLELPELDSGLLDKVSELAKIIKDLYHNIIVPLIEYIWSKMKLIWDVIVLPAIETMRKGLKTVFDWVREILDELQPTLESIFTSIDDFIDTIIYGISDLWNNWLSPIISAVWEKISPVLKDIFEWVVKIIDSGLKVAIDFIKRVIEILKPVGQLVADIISGVVDGIAKAWEWAKPYLNKFIGAFEFVVNKLIDAFNWLTNKLNAWKIDIPSWVPAIGGKSFGFNIRQMGKVELPRLAVGGIVNRPTQAIIGENGAEVVMPLERNTEWIDMLADRLNSNGQIVINVQLDGKTISKEIRKANEKYSFARNGI